MRFVFIVFLSTIFIVSCQSSPLGKAAKGQSLLADQFIEYAEILFSNRNTKPLKESIKKVPNRHVDDALDKWHTCEYDGYTIIYCEPGAAERNLLSSLTMTKSSTPLPSGINFGFSKNMITERLGKPTKTTNNTIEYHHSGDDYIQTVTFHFLNDSLKQIIWEYEIA